MLVRTAFAKGFTRCIEYDHIYRECQIGEFHVIRMYSVNVDPQIFALFLSSIDDGGKELSMIEQKLLVAPKGKTD